VVGGLPPRFGVGRSLGVMTAEKQMPRRAQTVTTEQITRPDCRRGANRKQAVAMEQSVRAGDLRKILQLSSCTILCCAPSSPLAAGDLAPPDLSLSSRCIPSFMAVTGDW
jgi:hypothetical protein